MKLHLDVKKLHGRNYQACASVVGAVISTSDCRYADTARAAARRVVDHVLKQVGHHLGSFGSPKGRKHRGYKRYGRRVR